MDPTRLIEKLAAKKAKRVDWNKWKLQLERFFKFEPKYAVDEEAKFNALLALGGSELEELYSLTPKAKLEKKKELYPHSPIVARPYTWAIERLDKYFEAGSNIQLEMSKFSEVTQNEEERFEQYLIRLKQQAEYCEFGANEDAHIIHQINRSARLAKVKTKALEPGITLHKLSAYAAQQEVIASSLAIQKKETVESESISAVHWQSKGRSSFRGRSFAIGNQREMKQQNLQCYRCGSHKHTANLKNCPAINQRCNRCNKVGHFARACKSAKAVTNRFNQKAIDENEEDSKKIPMDIQEINEKITQVIHFVQSLEKPRNELITGRLGEVIVTFTIDSGSPIDCLTEAVWEEVRERKVKIHNVKYAEECDREFYSYGNENPLRVIARFSTKLKIEHLEVETEFFVIKNARKSLISKTTGEKLGILRVGLDIVNLHEEGTRNIQQFPMLPVKPVKLHIDEKVVPVKQQYYRIPVAFEEETKRQLNWMLQVGIIERVKTPVDWISPMLVVPKANGGIRLVIDMRAANKAIGKIHHPLPNIDQFRVKLKGVRIMSKLDLTSAYHHVPLDVESRYITAFWSNIGLLQYTRLVFGLNTSPEVFQGIMEQLLSGIEGIIIFLDDILVAGKNLEEHDHKLARVTEILRQNSLTLNQEKCEYRKERMEFMGMEISSKGVNISPKKIEAVKNFRNPNNLEELMSFLGLVNYMSPFISDLASKTAVLRDIIKERRFKWTMKEQRTFDNLKEEIINCTMTLGYFDTRDETFLYTDGSGVGLGAVLVQKGSDKVPRVITCISRSLSETERKYPQVHREALAIAWATKRLEYYLIGIPFVLYTDNQALKFIFNQNKDLSKRACNRAAMYALELQMFRFTVEHIPSKQNISDVLSRLVTNEAERNEVCELTWPSENCLAITYEEIQKETGKDEIMQAIRKAIEENSWEAIEVKGYRAFKDEIYEWDNILWKDDRIILPLSLRKRALDVAHLGHPGHVSMTRMLRSRVWWLKIDEDAKEAVKACKGCVLVERTDPPEPLKMTIMPKAPWQHLAIDFFDASTHGIHLLVVIDYFSRYLCVKIMEKNKTVEEVINKLEELFAMFDFPVSIKCDNGPPFNSQALARYCKEKGIKLEHSIALWPQSNGQVEVQMKGIKKTLQIAIALKQDWKKALSTYVSWYNKRPHTITGKAPVALIMNREIRNLLPDTRESRPLSLDTEGIRDKDRILKQRNKEYADKKRKAVETSIEKNDTVLMQNKITNKLQTNFGSTEYKVVEKLGKKAIIQGEHGEKYERSASELKKIKLDEEKVPEPQIHHSEVDLRAKSTRVRKANTKYNDFVE